MPILNIVNYDHPSVREISQPVTEITEDIKTLMDDMVETMIDARGAGLAANQVDRLIRVIVMKDNDNIIKMINPVITFQSDVNVKYEEGCLSFPGFRFSIVRPKIVTVEYLDINGDKQEMNCDDILSICVQHEIDHLNGILFIDRISKLKQDMAYRKLNKIKKKK